MAVASATSTAVLFLVHRWTRDSAERFARLNRETAGHADCFVLLHDDGALARAAWPGFLESIDAARALRLFTAAELERRLGFALYARGRIVPGSAHYPVLDFCLTTAYRHYWTVEYDVEYRGNWLSFFERFRDCPADLLAAHVHRYEERPDWYWWRSLRPPPPRTLPDLAERRTLRKAFLPVNRLTAEAARAVAGAHRAGWRGHCEALVPTVLVEHGLDVRDLNDIATCYLGEDQDDCADPAVRSTLRWRPEIGAAEFNRRGEGALLFHPVKESVS